MPNQAFVGIDLAFAKGKRLPVCVVTREAGGIRPLALRLPGEPAPPRGSGNVASLDSATVKAFAVDVRAHLAQLEVRKGIVVRRVAIDAPSAPRAPHLTRRLAEQALDAAGISCFTTPCPADWDLIGAKVRAHLAAGGQVSRLPHANQLWMLVGFALFEELSEAWECIEVYPQATAFVLGANHHHKSSGQGLTEQLTAVGQLTGWPGPAPTPTFESIAWAPAHDRLDAYLAAWVASLEPEARRAFGAPPDDVIWVPAPSAGV